MITHKDQLNLFNTAAGRIKSNIMCFAFGGTAMMFYGYKEETKDIDLLFETIEDRNEFIQVIEAMGFKKSDPIKVYIPEKLRDKHRPVMYNREDARFDLFANKIFCTQISPAMREDMSAKHEFKGMHIMTVNVLRPEHIILLKSITDRQKDFDDIKRIMEKDKEINWEYIVGEAIWQNKHGDTWVLHDLEKTMIELKKYFFIQEKYFKMIYEASKSDDNIKKDNKKIRTNKIKRIRR